MLKYIQLLIFIFVPIEWYLCDASAEKIDYRFKKIGIEQGLSQSTILSIEQDSRGYIWFGTASGLNRYDGYEFQVYVNENIDSLSISGNEISAIFEDSKQNLWIGTTSGILNKFNPYNETFIRYDIAKSSDWYSSETVEFSNYPLSFSRNLNSTITSIAEDASGNLWIGTWGKGIVNFNPSTLNKKYFYHFRNRKNSLTSNKITELLIDSENQIWVGTFGGGLNMIKFSGQDTVEIFDFNKISNFDFGDQIIALHEDKDSNKWIGSYGGNISIIEKNKDNNGNTRIIKSVNEKFKVKDIPVIKNVMDIVEDKSSNIWIGTYGKGLFCYTKDGTIKHFNHNRMDPNSISEDEIQSLFVDNSGILWIGTQLGSGINKLEIGSYKFKSIPALAEDQQSLNDKIIWAICEDRDNKIWIGTHRGGINIWDKQNNTFTYLTTNDNLPDNHIRSFAEDGRGNMWIGTYSGGLSIFHKNGKKIENISEMANYDNTLSGNQVQSMLIYEDSLLFAGTFGGGLNILNLNEFYNDKKISFKSFVHDPSNKNSISNNKVYAIYKDSEDLIWIGTHGGGLNLFDKDSGTFIRFNSIANEKNSLSDNRIMVINESLEGDLLIGTFGGGLNLYKKDSGKFERLNKIMNFNLSDVYGIIKSKAGYWISSDNGIFKINMELNSHTQYDLSDGLQSLEFSGGAYAKGSDGVFYFGGINGVNYFNPEKIEFDDFVPPIVITSIKVFDQPVKGEKENLEFGLDENYFSFEFASLDFKNSNKNKYKFILEGLDSKWSYTDADNRRVFYTNLSPGDYTFRVMGTNADGIWSPHEANVGITILAPFWMRWWFISGLILFLGGLITFFINQRIRYLVALDKLKTNIAADLHDNVGAGLTEISILSELAYNDTQSNPAASRHIAQISDLSRQMVESMSDIVWVVNPARDSLYDLIVRLKDAYSELLLDLGIKLKTSNLENLIEVKLSMEFRQNLYLILKEALNNCLKHSKCENIDLDIIVNKNIISIKLSDDGLGFDKTTMVNGNGLTNIKKRGEKIGGNLHISSEIGKGTTIEFTGKIS